MPTIVTGGWIPRVRERPKTLFRIPLGAARDSAGRRLATHGPRIGVVRRYSLCGLPMAVVSR
jgi:hypothetical protein